MEQRNTNRYRMLGVLVAFFESHRTSKTWTTIPALARAVADLGTDAARVGEILEETSVPNGASAGKSACLKALVPAAYVVAAALHAYAEENDDAELAAQTDVSESDLRKGNEPDLVALCSKFSSLAADLVKDLSDYNVTQADLTALDKKIEAYAKDCPKPRQKVARNSATNRALPTLFRKTRRTIDRRINKLMAPFKTSAPDFYNEYVTARRIVEQAATQGEAKSAGKATPIPTTVPKAA